MIGHIIERFLRSDGSQWLFLSGLVLGVSGNLFVNALSSQPLPCNSARLVVISLCLGAASASFAALGWTLQQFEYMARSQDAHSTRARLEVKQRLVQASVTRLSFLGVFGVALVVAGMVGLLWQPAC